MRAELWASARRRLRRLRPTPTDSGRAIRPAGPSVALRHRCGGGRRPLLRSHRPIHAGRPGGRTYPRVNLLKWLPFRLLSHPLALVPLQLASVGLFLLVVIGGLVGEQEPTDNAGPTLVWILWWVGLAYVSALLGNVWAILNPWKIIFTWVEWAFVTATDGKELNLGYRYPVRFGVWPALVLFWAFAWIELVYVDAAIPAHLARLAINYSVITWAGMLIYGKDQWLRHGEAFTLVFGVPVQVRPHGASHTGTNPPAGRVRWTASTKTVIASTATGVSAGRATTEGSSTLGRSPPAFFATKLFPLR